jgi:hypothetical protein
VIVRPLAQDFDWDQYVDVTVRAFGPVDEVMVRPVIESAVAAGRCLGAFDQGRLVATALYAGTPVATLRRAGTLNLAVGGSQDADAALDGAFAATPFMLDGF